MNLNYNIIQIKFELCHQERSDARLRLINEILQGMRVVKLRAWEELFEQRIGTTRKRELELLDKDSLFWTFISQFSIRFYCFCFYKLMKHYFLKTSKQLTEKCIILNNSKFFFFNLAFLTHASSVLTTLFTFGVYFWLEEKNLDAGSVFASLALFSQLTVPLFIFPVIIPIIINAMVSVIGEIN